MEQHRHFIETSHQHVDVVVYGASSSYDLDPIFDSKETDPKMEVHKILHMKKGYDENSYANNSLVQRIVIAKTKAMLEESIINVYHTLKPKCLIVADMGCGSGPNALLVTSEIISVVDDICRSFNHERPELEVFLNDLPGNDFHGVFQLLPKLNESNLEACFVSATPKSFYGRVFPSQSLHFVHSSYSLHWLSQAPKETTNGVTNKGNIYKAISSPVEIQKAYVRQFAKDFTIFLRSRASEVVTNGRMVLAFIGRIHNDDPNHIFEILGSSFGDMLSEGIILEEQLNKFNVPIYFPTPEEIRELVGHEGSFTLNKLETYTVAWSGDVTQSIGDQAKYVATSIRAVMESLFVHAFGEAVVDDVFVRFKYKVEKHLAKQPGEYFNILVSLTKKA